MLGPHRRPVAYYSVQLNAVAKGTPGCIRAIAATATVLERTRPIVLGHPVTVYIPHKVELLLKQYATQALSPQRARQYELIILQADNVTLKRCNVLNPATLLPLPKNGKLHHSCKWVILSSSKPREDLQNKPLKNPDLVLFMDGSSYYLEGQCGSGYAVTDLNMVIEAEPLSPSMNAQGAELVALTRAAKVSQEMRVNIYTDSKYAFGICHATGRLWKKKGFLTSAGKNTANGPEVEQLLEAIQLSCCNLLPSSCKGQFGNCKR